MSADRPGSLVGRRPQVTPQRLLAELVPPPHFAGESFETYRPDPAHPSQQAARHRLRDVAAQLAGPGAGSRPTSSAAGNGRTGRLWRQMSGRTAGAPPAVYLDGGFGVGKTHLLASLAHAVGPEHTAYGTFVEITNLAGALGFAQTVAALSTRRLLCIDEFELDDPGDTVLMARLLRELSDGGVALAATSNTLPGSLGEGRFAAEDFLREIQALAGRFEVLRVDGQDYRHRETVTVGARVLDDDAVVRSVADRPGSTLDEFPNLVQHLSQVHPSRYGALLDGVQLTGWTGVRTLVGQAEALRFVVLVDRLYDRDIPVLLGGAGPEELFDQGMLTGGYRKKYYRALSRLRSLTAAGAVLAVP